MLQPLNRYTDEPITIAEVRALGFAPIRYHTADGKGKGGGPAFSEHRHGWIIERFPNGGALVQLIGEEGTRHIKHADMRYAVEF